MDKPPNDNEEVWVPKAELVRILSRLRDEVAELEPSSENASADPYLAGVKDAFDALGRLLGSVIDKAQAFPEDEPGADAS